MAKMTPQEYKKSVIKGIGNPIAPILVFLGITNIKVGDRNAWKNNNDYYYSIREINPYNPLSYIVALLFIPVALIIRGFNKETFKDIKRLFKYN
jgi:hypothetical protein